MSVGICVVVVLMRAAKTRQGADTRKSLAPLSTDVAILTLTVPLLNARDARGFFVESLSYLPSGFHLGIIKPLTKI